MPAVDHDLPASPEDGLAAVVALRRLADRLEDAGNGANSNGVEGALLSQDLGDNLRGLALSQEAK